MLDCRKNTTESNRRFCAGYVAAIEDVPPVLRSSSDPCCLFLAVDATAVSDAAIRNVARRLLQHGIAYLCVWGPDCERVHDQFDLERMPEEPKGRVVMTTWHSKEGLSDALWFFATCAERTRALRQIAQTGWPFLWRMTHGPARSKLNSFSTNWRLLTRRGSWQLFRRGSTWSASGA